MSIRKIKEIASILKSGKMLSIISSVPQLGSLGIGKQLKELLNLIEEYKEPDPIVDVPPKRRTRRNLKKEDTIE